MDFSLLGLQGLHEVFNVHPVFVHFPLALFPSALLLYGLAVVLNWRAAAVAGRACLVEPMRANPTTMSPIVKRCRIITHIDAAKIATIFP